MDFKNDSFAHFKSVGLRSFDTSRVDMSKILFSVFLVHLIDLIQAYEDFFLQN